MDDLSAAGGTMPRPESDASRPPVCFAGLILDLDACTLARETGEPIALTRGELALLREFVRRPGRVLSRDQLLDAVARRRADPFDRSIDVLVGRLRRKIEPDPKRPSLIVTVPGEGYRFSVTPAPRVAQSDGTLPGYPARQLRVRGLPYALGFLLLLLVAAGAWRLWPSHVAASGPPGVIVLPFANLSGDSSQDYLGSGMADELKTLLGTFPALRVVSATAAGPEPEVVRAAAMAGVQYVVHGGVYRSRERLRVTAQLYDGVTGSAVWGDRFDMTGADPSALQEEVANRIYDSIAGLRGRIRSDEERAAWAKSGPGLDEYDYYVRGLSHYLRFTVPDVLQARRIWQEGLDKFPGSALLMTKLGFSHLYVAMNATGEIPRGDIDQAWALAKAAAATDSKSRLTAWTLHWLMALLYQWHDNDFIRSVAEARAAVDLVPYDAMSRNDLSWVLANAGHADEAIAWALMGLQRDPNGPGWFHGNLAWAYYVGGRYQEAYDALRGRGDDFPPMFAVICVRLGRIDEARAAIAAERKAGVRDSIALQGAYPQIEPDRTAFLAAAREAGLPDN